MDKTWPHLFNTTLVVLTLLLGEQLDVVSSGSHACLSASPASVYLLVKLINWFGTWLACAARPEGLVFGVLLIRWVLGSWLASIGSGAFSEPTRQNRGTASGSGCLCCQGLSAEREEQWSVVLLCPIAFLRSHAVGLPIKAMNLG